MASTTQQHPQAQPQTNDNDNNNPSKVQVPSPLPSRRGTTQLPTHLRENLTSALLGTNAAIPALHASLSRAMDASGWTERVKAYLLEVLRSPEGEALSDREILEAVVAGSVEGGDGKEALKIGDGVVEAAVEELKGALDGVCVVVDDVDWEGLG